MGVLQGCNESDATCTDFMQPGDVARALVTTWRGDTHLCHQNTYGLVTRRTASPRRCVATRNARVAFLSRLHPLFGEGSR